MTYRDLDRFRHPFRAGDPIPWFRARTLKGDEFDVSSVAGRYLVISFIGSIRNDVGRAMLDGFAAASKGIDQSRIAFIGVIVDPTIAVASLAGTICMLGDSDHALSQAFGSMTGSPAQGQVTYSPQTYVVDPNLRVAAHLPVQEPVDAHAMNVMAQLADLMAGAAPSCAEQTAPVLVLPGVFEREFCHELIEGYCRDGGHESGVMREVNGKTVGVINHAIKRRRDWEVSDERSRAGARARISRRLIPEIEKAFQFMVTRMERYIVACYDSATGGYFRPHRDNTTGGTAHRRFAVTINLNADEYEGGDLVFPEYGARAYRAPTGGAVVFSCSLLHEARPVLSGTRYAFLPFLYDEAAAGIRESNNASLGQGVGHYSKG